LSIQTTNPTGEVIAVSKARRKHSKADALREEGALNVSPEKVRDPKFREGEFFDPLDIVQVKYEMLRRVRVENSSVTHAAGEYGVSRPTYYQAREGFEQAGIPGLVPKKRGPRGRHKLKPEVVAFLERQLVPGQPIRARELAKLLREEFRIDVHPRTIERVVGGKKNLQ
jgi:transposase